MNPIIVIALAARLACRSRHGLYSPRSLLIASGRRHGVSSTCSAKMQRALASG
jgi:hypothetical protein